MPAVPTPQSARAQLMALADAVATGRGGRGFEAFAALPMPTAPRTSAVLMLFGVLDGQASDHAPDSKAVSRELDVLLLERASTLRSHPGQVAFPGGRLDPDDDGPVAAALRETDVHVCVPHDRTARIQEVHLLTLHCICDGVDSQLLGDQETTT